MFIAKYPDGKIITEKDMFWDEVPSGMNRVELSIPIKVSYIDPETKKEVIAPARTVSLSGYDKYFFYNEAVASIAGNGKGGAESKLVAKAIGGIIGDNVVEVRIDAGGYSNVRHFKLDQLAQSGIKQGA